MSSTNISIVEVKAFKTSDDKTFDTREKAIDHEKYLSRVKNIEPLIQSHKENDIYMEEEEGGELFIYKHDLPSYIALMGEELIDALTIKQARGRGALKAA